MEREPKTFMQTTMKPSPVIRWNGHSLGGANGAAHTQQSVNALSVLSPGEQKELADCEAVIEKGWQTFVEVGLALARIRDNKLYRAQHDTFEAYCREKWQYAKSHAYRLIGAAEAVAYLSPIGDIPVPTHEAQVRPLIGLEAAKAKLAWEKAVEKAGAAMVTAKLVRAAVLEVLGKTLGKQPRATANKPKARMDRRALEGVLELLSQAESRLKAGESPKTVLRLLAGVRDRLVQWHR